MTSAHLELDQVAHVDATDDAHARSRKEAELHEAAAERTLAADPDQTGAASRRELGERGVAIQLRPDLNDCSVAGGPTEATNRGHPADSSDRAEDPSEREGYHPPVDRAKEACGRRAAEFVEDGTIVGLGTGSTVWFTLVRLAERIAEEGLSIRGVPTSRDTETKARELGIPLTTLAEIEAIDLTVDGADEVDPELNLIKGGGGALLREKIVASISRREVIVVGRDKLVERLGTTFDLPVESVPFARATVERALRALGCRPRLRLAADELGAYTTDNGNEIFDCAFKDGIADPRDLEARLAAVPGIVESGLFVGLAHVLVVGNADGGVEVRESSHRSRS